MKNFLLLVIFLVTGYNVTAQNLNTNLRKIKIKAPMGLLFGMSKGEFASKIESKGGTKQFSKVDDPDVLVYSDVLMPSRSINLMTAHFINNRLTGAVLVFKTNDAESILRDLQIRFDVLGLKENHRISFEFLDGIVMFLRTEKGAIVIYNTEEETKYQIEKRTGF